MTLDVQVKALEKEKIVLEGKLKELKIKQAQMLKLKQLKDDIFKLKLDIKTIQDEVIEVVKVNNVEEK